MYVTVFYPIGHSRQCFGVRDQTLAKHNVEGFQSSLGTQILRQVSCFHQFSSVHVMNSLTKALMRLWDSHLLSVKIFSHILLSGPLPMLIDYFVHSFHFSQLYYGIINIQ